VFGYAAQAGLYFSALTRIDASLVALLLYVYPVVVMAGAIVIGRERAVRRRVYALGIALAGIALVLGGTATTRFDGLGAAMALGAALTYTGYILLGDRLTADIAPLALAALVCTGATGTFTLAGVVRGAPDLSFGAAGWAWLAALALVSTVGAILLFFAGLARVGPSIAAILSILEPVVTVTLAAAVFGETLSAAQLLGGMLVLAAVAITQWPTATRGGPSRTPGGAGTHPVACAPAAPGVCVCGASPVDRPCSTTMTELPRSTSRSSSPSRCPQSDMCSPFVGSSST
jgi:drug/metabolite transporter (DMT)-like permease